MSAGIGGVRRPSMGGAAQPALIDSRQLARDIGQWVAADPFTRSSAQAAVFEQLGRNPAAGTAIRIVYSGEEPGELISLLRGHQINLTVVASPGDNDYDQPPVENGPSPHDVAPGQAPPSYNEVFHPQADVAIAAVERHEAQEAAEPAALAAGAQQGPDEADFLLFDEMFQQAPAEPAPQLGFERREPSAPFLNPPQEQGAYHPQMVAPSAPFLHQLPMNMVQPSAPLMMPSAVAGPMVVNVAYPPEGAAPQEPAGHLSSRVHSPEPPRPPAPVGSRLFGDLWPRFVLLELAVSDLGEKDFGPRSVFNRSKRDQEFQGDILSLLKEAAALKGAVLTNLPPEAHPAAYAEIKIMIERLASVVVDKAHEDQLHVPKMYPLIKPTGSEHLDRNRRSVMTGFDAFVQKALQPAK